jgi:hypothetical protein
VTFGAAARSNNIVAVTLTGARHADGSVTGSCHHGNA